MNKIGRLGLKKFPKVEEEGKALGSDTNKYCRCHRAKGHDIEDCYTLRMDIEKLIQAGHLKGFVRGRPDNRDDRVV